MKKLYVVILCCLLTTVAFAQVNKNLTLRSHVPYTKPCSNIWGYVDTLGNEYALVGTWEGVSIVDVTNPDAPRVVKNIPSVQPHDGSIVYREIKTWHKYAYVVNETDSGILIIDLSHLPDTSQITYHHFTGQNIKTAHTLWVDEKGILYAYGFNTYNSLNNTLFLNGVMMFDLKQNPWLPTYVSQYNAHYLHDGFVRGDTLWGSEIYEGKMVVLNIKDSSSFKVLGSVQTPLAYTHTAWPNSNNKLVFTTDEKTNSTLTSYDASDLNAISKLGTVASNPGSGSSIHNVHLLNDTFAVTSYYTDGVVVFDVSRPTNMVEVGNYDTSPLSGYGIPAGCWGVYPFLPSGNIIASDVQQGLFVLSPHYKRACWLEGVVTDSATSLALSDALIKILPAVNSATTNGTGQYYTGTPDSGTYSVQFTSFGYQTKTIHNVTLRNAVVTTLNAQLLPDTSFSITIAVTDSLNQPVKNAKVWLTLSPQYSQIFTTDVNGTVTVPQLYKGSYTLYAGAWGYNTVQVSRVALTPASGTQIIKIGKGYYDDFTFDLGWQKTGDAGNGPWQRAQPAGVINSGILLNPLADVPNDIGNTCYLTGNGAPNNQGVINGTAVLTTPSFNLTLYVTPMLKYYSWFANFKSNQPGNDSLTVTLSNGITSVNIDVEKAGSDTLSAWELKTFNLNNYIRLTDSMTLTFATRQTFPVSGAVLAGLDKFEIYDAGANAVSTPATNNCKLTTYPNPFSNSTTVYYCLNNIAAERQLLVTDVMGKTLLQQNLTGNTGSLQLNTNWEAGMYLITVTENGKRLSTVKVVKY